MNKTIKIAIIDSGMSSKIEKNDNIIRGYALRYDESKGCDVVVSDECIDEIGHGTAVLDIITKNIRGIYIDVFKLYYDQYEIEEEAFIKILNFISDNNIYDVLHISSGIIQSSNYNLMYSICKEIFTSGTIIISAFDNEGAVSYPAAFPFVIGVDLSQNKLNISEYEFVDNSIINIRGSSSFHRLLWTKPSTMLAQGTSFSSVYITLKVIDILFHGVIGFDNILLELKKQAVNSYSETQSLSYDSEFVRGIRKVIVFPFNKEIHSLLRYKEDLLVEIVGVYDCKYSLKTNKKVQEIDPSIQSDELIQDVSRIDWNDDFDTVILGHTDHLNLLSGINYKNQIISKCKEYNKKIFSFDKIENEYNKNVFYTKVTLDMVPKNRFGKMRSLSKPVLGIWGTSSQQGKFTLQMKIKKELSQVGYKVGWLSTEPQGALFGADRVFPIGYNSTVEITDIQSVTLLNEYMWEIDCLECDIILVGSQSGTVPFSLHHLSSYPVYQYDMLVGTQPDYVILCINAHDEYEYIKRTIKFIEGSIDTKVIGLVVYPLVQQEVDITGRYKKSRLSEKEMDAVVNSLEKYFEIKAYPLYSTSLKNDIIDTFSRGE